MLEIRTIIQRYHAWITLLFVYTFLASVALYKGNVQSPDTQSFVNWADLLINHQFNFFSFFSDSHSVNSGDAVSKSFFYIIPVTIIAVLKALFNDHWVSAFQASNLVALFFTLFFYTQIALHFKIRKWLVSASLLTLLISIDYLLWPRYILTDTLFTSLVMFSIYSVTTRTHNYFRSHVLIIAAAFLLLFTRPSALPIATVILFFSFLPSLSQTILTTNMLFIRLISLISVSTILFSLIIMASTSGVIESDYIDFSRTWVEQGLVIHDRPDIAIRYEETYLGIAKLFLYRMVGFFTPFANSYSLIHNALNGILFLGCYITILGMSSYSFRDFEKNTKRAMAIALLSTLIISVAIFQSATVIDYDWRYRYPVIAPLILLAALIFDNFLNSREVKSNYGAK
jgi:hypothetical protein